MRTGERIAERRQTAGLSQTALARLAGVSQGTIGKLEAGLSSGSSHLHKIARALGTTSEYLTGETEDPEAGAVPAPTEREIAQHLDLVPIATIDQEYGMGSAFIADHIEPEVLQFPRAWIEGFTLTPSHMLTFARGRGDSMQPAIMHNDMVLIDRSQRVITEPDAIWAYADGDMGGIKRLRLKGDRVIILSDNPSIPPDEAFLDAIAIVGRVIMVIRSI